MPQFAAKDDTIADPALFKPQLDGTVCKDIIPEGKQTEVASVRNNMSWRLRTMESMGTANAPELGDVFFSAGLLAF